MTQYAVIESRLPGLNEYVKANRGNKYAGAKMKRETEDICQIFLRDLVPVSKPVKISFVWYEKTLRRDLDNIAFAKKFILDTMTRLGILQDDSPKYVVETHDKIQKGNDYYVEITIEEVGT